MSGKPSVVPRWGNVSGAIVVPSSGKQDVGWLTAERPPAQYLNYLHKNLGDWAQWLSDGDCAFHNLSATGTLDAAGATTCVALTASGLVTANAGLTLGNNQNLTLAGTGTLTVGATGDVKHGARELGIHGSAFIPAGNNDSNSRLSDFWTLGTPPNDTLQAAIQGLRVGDRILSITWYYNKASNASALTMSLRRRNGTTNSNIDSLADVTTGAAFTSITRGSINYTIVTGDAVIAKVQAGSNVHQFSHATISYDHP